MFRTWITKHSSGFCGSNRLLSKIDHTIENTCPCCGCHDESVAHLTRCRDPGRQLAFKQSIDILTAWMTETHTDPDVVSCISVYFTQLGEGSMTEIARPFPSLKQWATQHDTLGWDNFLEGRIGSELVKLQRVSLADNDSRLHINTWAAKLVQLLLSITHNQWIYRNTKMHLRSVEEKTLVEHDDVMKQVLRLISTDPDDILPSHRHLLDVDLKLLGEGATADRQYWIANMTSALASAQVVQGQPLSSKANTQHPHVDHIYEFPAPDQT